MKQQDKLRETLANKVDCLVTFAAYLNNSYGEYKVERVDVHEDWQQSVMFVQAPNPVPFIKTGDIKAMSLEDLMEQPTIEVIYLTLTITIKELLAIGLTPYGQGVIWHTPLVADIIQSLVENFNGEAMRKLSGIVDYTFKTFVAARLVDKGSALDMWSSQWTGMGQYVGHATAMKTNKQIKQVSQEEKKTNALSWIAQLRKQQQKP